MTPLPLKTSVQIAPAERSAFILPSLTVLSAILIWILVRKLEIGLIPFLESFDKHVWLVVTVVALLLLFALFSIGHMIDQLSHTILERFMADKMDGFPHERIVPLMHSTCRYHRFLRRKRTKYMRPTFLFEGAKLFIASTSAIFFSAIISRHPDINSFFLTAFKCVDLYSKVTLVYSLLLAVPKLAVGYLPLATYTERRRFFIKWMRRFRSTFRGCCYRSLVMPIKKITNCALLMPYVFLYDCVDKIVRGLFRLNKEIDAATYKKIASVFMTQFDIEYSSIENNDRYWLLYFLLVAIRPNVMQKIQNARSSATYCRNQALACLFAALLLAGVYRIDQQSITGLLTRADIIHLALFLYSLGWIFHWRFLQNYYSCTKMTLLAFASLPTKTSST